MPIQRKTIEIPPEAVREFVAAAQTYHAAYHYIRRVEIIVRTRRLLLDHMPKGTKLRLSEVRNLFDRMRPLS